jgi:hypothetical protein
MMRTAVAAGTAILLHRPAFEVSVTYCLTQKNVAVPTTPASLEQLSFQPLRTCPSIIESAVSLS